MSAAWESNFRRMKHEVRQEFWRILFWLLTGFLAGLAFGELWRTL